MTDQLASADLVEAVVMEAAETEAAALETAIAQPAAIPNPAQAFGGKKPAKGTSKQKQDPADDADKFLREAKRLVVDNYNAHRDTSKTPALTADLCYIIWFTKTVDNWKAIVGSKILHGLMYEVSYVGSRSKAYIGVYRKINSVTISY